MNQLNSQAAHSSTAYQRGYQQALSDFGIKELLAKLRDLNPGKYVEEQDQESLIALLIQQLTNNLNSKLLNNYFQALESDFFEVLLQEIQPLSEELPIHFKENAIPCYKDGESLRWIPAKGGVDWGTAIGRFYAYAPHLCRWSWKYIILLDSHSPSAAWVKVDTAWQEDVEPLEETRRGGDTETRGQKLDRDCDPAQLQASSSSIQTGQELLQTLRVPVSPFPRVLSDEEEA